MVAYVASHCFLDNEGCSKRFNVASGSTWIDLDRRVHGRFFARKNQAAKLHHAKLSRSSLADRRVFIAMGESATCPIEHVVENRGRGFCFDSGPCHVRDFLFIDLRTDAGFTSASTLERRFLGRCSLHDPRDLER